jgi:hypothetical protein
MASILPWIAGLFGRLADGFIRKQPILPIEPTPAPEEPERIDIDALIHYESESSSINRLYSEGIRMFWQSGS